MRCYECAIEINAAGIEFNGKEFCSQECLTLYKSMQSFLPEDLKPLKFAAGKKKVK